MYVVMKVLLKTNLPNLESKGVVWLVGWVGWSGMIPLLGLFGSESKRGGMIPLRNIPCRSGMTLPPKIGRTESPEVGALGAGAHERC
jgi:hypothetical protein